MRIWVVYTTHNGSTKEVASVVGDELAGRGTPSEVASIESVANLDRFSGVVIGAPMMFGWHPAAIQFITKHLPSLQRKPTAFFMMAMRLTDIGEKDIEGVPFFTDPGLSRPAPNPDRLSLPERFSTVRNYLRPVLKNSPGFFPVSVGFFGGKLDTRRLNPVQWLFVRLILRIPSEDKRNRQAIRSWTADIHEHLSHG